MKQLDTLPLLRRSKYQGDGIFFWFSSSLSGPSSSLTLRLLPPYVDTMSEFHQSQLYGPFSHYLRSPSTISFMPMAWLCLINNTTVSYIFISQAETSHLTSWLTHHDSWAYLLRCHKDSSNSRLELRLPSEFPLLPVFRVSVTAPVSGPSHTYVRN